jgi:hypothetical protein
MIQIYYLAHYKLISSSSLLEIFLYYLNGSSIDRIWRRKERAEDAVKVVKEGLKWFSAQTVVQWFLGIRLKRLLQG